MFTASILVSIFRQLEPTAKTKYIPITVQIRARMIVIAHIHCQDASIGLN